MSHPLFPLIDANLVESVREFARWQQGGEIVERDGVLLVAGTTRFPVVSNAALRLDPEVAPASMLETVFGYFRDRRRGFTIWIRPRIDEDVEAAARGAGFREVSTSPWMALDAPIPDGGAVPGLEIREVKDEAGVLAARDINREAYTALEMPSSEVDAVYGTPRRVLSPPCRTFVGYENGRPVTTAMLLMTHGVAGVYWVGTVAAARGKGYAAAITRAVSHAGFESGARVVTLQASVMGESIYQRLGYRTIGNQKWLLSPKPVRP